MEKSVLIKRLKNKFISKEEKFKDYYKKSYHTYQFLKNIADPKFLKPCKGELREYQLSLLSFAKTWFDEFEKQGVKYFLISGNLLGAYRNKGFIPWDDDIDIGMIRDDFDKLIEYLRKNCLEVDVSEISYSKRNRSFVINEFIKKNPNKMSFAIFPTHLQILQGDNMKNLMTLDIHPYDYYSDDYTDEEIKKDINLIKRQKTKIDNFAELNKYLKELRLSNNKIGVKSNKIYYGYDNYDITFLPFTDWYKVDEIFPVKKVDYEDTQCCVPNKPEKSLLINYGNDYMSMPKEIIFNSHIGYRETCEVVKHSLDKQVMLKKIERKFRFSKEKKYKELYKKTKPLADLMLDIVDIKTIKPCQEKRLRQYQLDCVEFAKKMTDFFDAHNLEYFITSGTLIGVVRHGGFVPWDDDFDVGMMRKDYERLKLILKENFKSIDISKISVSKGNLIQVIDSAELLVQYSYCDLGAVVNIAQIFVFKSCFCDKFLKCQKFTFFPVRIIKVFVKYNNGSRLYIIFEKFKHSFCG